VPRIRVITSVTSRPLRSPALFTAAITSRCRCTSRSTAGPVVASTPSTPRRQAAGQGSPVGTARPGSSDPVKPAAAARTDSVTTSRPHGWRGSRLRGAGDHFLLGLCAATNRDTPVTIRLTRSGSGAYNCSRQGCTHSAMVPGCGADRRRALFVCVSGGQAWWERCGARRHSGPRTPFPGYPAVPAAGLHARARNANPRQRDIAADTGSVTHLTWGDALAAEVSHEPSSARHPSRRCLQRGHRRSCAVRVASCRAIASACRPTAR
jgi:hypothetical protein